MPPDPRLPTYKVPSCVDVILSGKARFPGNSTAPGAAPATANAAAHISVRADKHRTVAPTAQLTFDDFAIASSCRALNVRSERVRIDWPSIPSDNAAPIAP